jgi:hypothetical protein
VRAASGNSKRKSLENAIKAGKVVVQNTESFAAFLSANLSVIS